MNKKLNFIKDNLQQILWTTFEDESWVTTEI